MGGKPGVHLAADPPAMTPTLTASAFLDRLAALRSPVELEKIQR